ncbi:MAG TPA: ribose 5-phosphate isomerase A [Bryobacteraceae bacterium]|nr:ribose 5-phosphate isomerase A [Bryobacteraceae bacterium]
MNTDEKDPAIIGLKRAAASRAAAQIESGMVVGLGSGSTSRLAVEAIGQRVHEGLKIIGIPTSEQTAGQARALGIPLSTLGEYPEIDLAIDGADEVELGTLNLIKGGGGNQLREKIVASASRRFLVIVDERKVVHQLGSRAKVPVEVAQFGWQATARKLDNLNGNPVLRLGSDGQPFITDGGNYILDCAFGPIASPAALDRGLNDVVGVIEHGLFIRIAVQALVGTDDGIQVLDRK